MAIHDRIKKIRSEFFKSNLDFATKLGEKPNTTSNWISGTRKIGLEVVEKIASKLPNINIDWLITGQGEMLKSTSENNSRNVHNTGKISGGVMTGEGSMLKQTVKGGVVLHTIGSGNVTNTGSIRGNVHTSYSNDERIKELELLLIEKEAEIKSLKNTIEMLIQSIKK